MRKPAAQTRRLLLDDNAAAWIAESGLGLTVWEVAENAIPVRWSEQAADVLGHGLEAFTDPGPVPFESGSARAFNAALREVSEHERETTRTLVSSRPDGVTVATRWRFLPASEAEGGAQVVAALVEDVTALEIAEREARSARRRLIEVIERLPLLVWALDEQGHVAVWNDFAERLTGVDRLDAIEPGVLEGLLPELDHPRRALTLGPEFNAADYDDWEQPLRAADGTTRRVLWSNFSDRCPMPGWSAWGTGKDVTEERKALQELRASEQRAEGLLETIDLAAVIIDASARVLYVNGFFLQLTGWRRDEAVGADWVNQFVLPEHRSRSLAGLRAAFTERPFALRDEGDLRTRDGGTRRVMWSKVVLRDADRQPIALAALGLDITERRRTDAELAEHRAKLERLVEERTDELVKSYRRLAAAERLAAIGELSAGLGHDIANILFPVRCHLDAVKTRVPRDTEEISAIENGLDLLERLGGDLRLLAKSPQPEAVNAETVLAEWWGTAVPLLRGHARGDIEVVCEITEDAVDPGGVVGVAGHELGQIAINLVANAVEATMQAESAAELDAESDRATSSSIVTARLSIDRDRSAAVLEVEDSGIGMTATVRERALEPFFTTKTRGRSTGLGLAVVGGILQRIGGTADFDSEPGRGTTAIVRIPLTEASPQDDATRTAVVLIEDQRPRALHVAVLESAGYRVETPNSAGSLPREPDVAVVTRLADAPEMSKWVVLVGEGTSETPIPTETSRVPADARVSELRTMYTLPRGQSAQAESTEKSARENPGEPPA